MATQCATRAATVEQLCAELIEDALGDLCRRGDLLVHQEGNE